MSEPNKASAVVLAFGPSSVAGNRAYSLAEAALAAGQARRAKKLYATARRHFLRGGARNRAAEALARLITAKHQANPSLPLFGDYETLLEEATALGLHRITIAAQRALARHAEALGAPALARQALDQVDLGACATNQDLRTLTTDRQRLQQALSRTTAPLRLI